MYDFECQNTVSNLYSIVIEGEYVHHCFINLCSIQYGYLINQPALVLLVFHKVFLGLMLSCLYSIPGNFSVARSARLWPTLGCSDLKQVPPDVPRILR